MLNRDQKKVLSSSFSKITVAPSIQKVNSFSADKLTTFKTQERGTERNIVLKVIESLNENKDRNEVEWRLNSFDQKRTISGFKARIQWMSTGKDMKVVLKINFASSYFRLANHLSDGDIFVQIEELNFVLSTQEMKELQERIEKILANNIQLIKSKAYNDETKKQSECLRRFLQDVNSQLQLKIYEGRKRNIQKIDKKLSKKYMLYPAPATFAWNPLGGICITENKYPLHKKTFYGEPNTLRKYFESARHDIGFNLRQDQSNLQLNSGASCEAIYDWKIEEEVELVIFSRERSFKRDDRYYLNRIKNEPQSQSKKQEKKKNEQDSVPIANLNRLTSNKLRKIYERYFGAGERTSQFHRHDKLRVYDVKSFNKDYEDDIVYMFEKMGSDEQRRLSNLFQNELSAYPGMLEEMNQIKYRLLGNILIQNLANPKLQFYNFLKLFILENHFLGAEMERYFKQIYRIIKRIPHHQLYYIGSYNHFDNIKAQLLFIDILQTIIEIGESQERLIKTIAIQESAQIKIKTKVRLPKFNFESIVSEAEKNNFLMNLFPILIVKDREMQKFEFKQLKRIITANSKLFQFIKKMNEIISKFEDGKTGFIRSLIQNYRRYREHDENQEAMALQSRRIFYIHCSNCQKTNKLFDLNSREDMEFCSKCKRKLLHDGI